MSLRKAINNKCKDCIYDKFDKGTWRGQVSACLSDDCALHPYRPVDSATKAERLTNSSVNLTVKEVLDRKARVERAKINFN